MGYQGSDSVSDGTQHAIKRPTEQANEEHKEKRHTGWRFMRGAVGWIVIELHKPTVPRSRAESQREMAKLEQTISEFMNRHGAIFSAAGLIAVLLSLYFVTKTEADQKYARRDDVTEMKADIRQIRDLLLKEGRK